MPSDRRLTQIGTDILLNDGGECGLAHVIFPVNTGIDQHVDVASRFPCMREAGFGGFVGEAPGASLAQSVAGQRAGRFNACAHSVPPGCR